ncbi:MAG: YceI family protein [Bacteroidetes bacterium]|nr:YceI family protein [Bacteroidota bacterium]MBL0071253.1 YceI family protein [Bacteroidota bacterium]
MIRILFMLLWLPLLSGFNKSLTSGPVVFKTTKGSVSLVSDAPLEVIKADSKELRGVIDTSNHTFAFTVAIVSFKGFNSPLQREHFQENYMESHLYPVATFTGKIIESVSFSKNGIYEVRAKGVLSVHGVKQERIIKGKVEVTSTGIVLNSEFKVVLEDHEIKIPRIVHQKIAPEISIIIEALLLPETR